ncbi:MAG TPA: hypothetical protein VGO62_15620, partial [Myxococcota bacterium]
MTSACSSCAGAATPCASKADCEANEECQLAASGGGACVVVTGEGEGEGAEGEGAEGEGAEGEGAEGEGAEGEGAASEGEGAAGEGEGEGIAVTATALLGLHTLATMPSTVPIGVWSSPDRGTIVVDEHVARWRPPGSALFARAGFTGRIDHATSELGTVGQNVALTPSGAIVFCDNNAHQAKSVPLTDDFFAPTVILGDGTTGTAVDPPGFVFGTDPLAVQLEECEAVDVDSAGTIYVADGQRAIAVDPDGTTRVVAGSIASNNTSGTQAQNKQLGITALAIESDASGAPLALWLGPSFARVTLATGAFEDLSTGSGTACADQPIAGCGFTATAVVADNVGGAYLASEFEFAGRHAGIFHVDSARNVRTLVSSADLDAIPLHLALGDAPGHVLAVDFFATGIVDLVDDGSATGPSAASASPPPPIARGTDALDVTFASGMSDSELFFFDGGAFRAIDESGAMRLIASVADAPPECSALSFLNNVDTFAVSRDGNDLWFSGNNLICHVDTASGAFDVAFPSVTAPGRLAFRSDALLAISSGAVLQVPLDGSAVTTRLAANAFVDIAGASDDTVQVMRSNGTRSLIHAPPSNTVDSLPAGSGLTIEGIAAAPNLDFPGETFGYSALEHEIVVVDETGTESKAAGGSVSAGYRDGVAASALFEDGHARIQRFASGNVALVFATSIRLLTPGAAPDGGEDIVSTLRGSDQGSSDGD